MTPSSPRPSDPRPGSGLDEERVRSWHERAYRELRDRAEPLEMEYLGCHLVVPPEVFAPTPMSDLLGRAVLEEVRHDDRVLDMGTGSGVNAVLAARRSRDVVGVDVNPHAVACARANADRNGVGDRVEVRESRGFESVDGTFDLVVIDPPFRWFRPRNLLEASIADEGYEGLREFLRDLPGRLREGGRLLLFFGTSGDVAFVDRLIAQAGLSGPRIAERELHREDGTAVYYVRRLHRA